MIKHAHERIRRDAEALLEIAGGRFQDRDSILCAMYNDQERLLSRFICIWQAQHHLIASQLQDPANGYSRIELEIMYTLASIDMLFGERPELVEQLGRAKRQVFDSLMEEVGHVR